MQPSDIAELDQDSAFVADEVRQLAALAKTMPPLDAVGAIANALYDSESDDPLGRVSVLAAVAIVELAKRLP